MNEQKGKRRKNTKNEEQGNEEVKTGCTSSEKKKRSRKERAMAKILRNTGKEYKTENGKRVKERQMKSLSKCRMKCKERFPDDVRLKIFEDYWNQGDHSKRTNFISSLICILEKKTTRIKHDSGKLRKFSCRYEVGVMGDRKPICKKCFIDTFGETNAFINQIIQKRQSSISGIMKDDQRGRSEPTKKWTKEVLDDVVNHIKSFPAYESHYCRETTSKKYLQSDLTLSKRY